MDILIPVILMIVLYVVPELLKRRKPTEYKYPDIPDKIPPVNTQPQEMKHKPPVTEAYNVSIPSTMNAWAAANKPVIAMPDPVTAPQCVEQTSAWQGNLSPQMVQNGFIFAEIIQPPRAYRPIWRRK